MNIDTRVEGGRLLLLLLFSFKTRLCKSGMRQTSKMIAIIAVEPEANNNAKDE